MKKIILNLITFLIISNFCNSQNIRQVITAYENHCNDIVKDTLFQYGKVMTELVPVSGNIVKVVPVDTIWQEFKCPEYCDESPTISVAGKFVYIGDKVVRREKICTCKRKRPKPFSLEFW